MNEDLIYEDFEHANLFKLGEMTGQKIIHAIKDNDVNEIKKLMNLSVDKGGLILLRLLAKDKNGETVKDIALKSNNEEIIKIFK